MKYDIEALKRKMLVKYPFFGSVVANVEYKEKNDIETAATDGEVIYYNTDFLQSLSVDEQTFVFAHEVCHIAFNHILRSEGKNHKLWNIATDGVINQFLKKDGLSIPQGGVDIPEAINYDAEKLYEKLLKEHQQNQQNNQSSNQNSSNNNQGSSSSQSTSENNSQSQQSSSSSNESNNNSNDSKENSQSKDREGSSQSKEENKEKNAGHDSHSMWDDAVKRSKEKQKKSKESKDSKKNNDNSKESKAKSEIEKKQEELEKMGEKDAFDKNREEKKKELERLKEELSRKASQAGTTSNGNVREVGNIGNAKPLIDWRYVLKETIKYDVDWSYRNAMVEDGVVMANLEEIPMPETEIVLDTSESVSVTLLKNFLKECKNILKHSKLKVGCFDTEFYGFTEIRTEEDIDNMRFEGNGGTNFNTAVNAFSNRVENKIIFTDGYAPMPKKAIDAVWLVYGDRKIQPPGGKVIYITSEQLNKLYSFKDDIKKLTRKL